MLNPEIKFNTHIQSLLGFEKYKKGKDHLLAVCRLDGETFGFTKPAEKFE